MIASSHSLIHKRHNIDNKCFLFVDEVQDIASFEKALRHFFAEGSFDIYCTGSNANMLSGELATYLSGRYIEFKVYSLTYNEMDELKGDSYEGIKQIPIRNFLQKFK